MQKMWESLVFWYYTRTKPKKRLIMIFVISCLFGGFGWSEHHWTSGGSFGVAMLIQLIPATLAFFYGLVCWEADLHKKAT